MKTKIVNSVYNGSARIKRKVAEYFVAEGRAEWVGDNQIRLVMSHPKNQAAEGRASAWAREHNPPARERQRDLDDLIVVRPERRPLRSTAFPDGHEPRPLRGTKLPHETATPIRPAAMRQTTAITHDGRGRVWQPYGKTRAPSRGNL